MSARRARDRRRRAGRPALLRAAAPRRASTGASRASARSQRAPYDRPTAVEGGADRRTRARRSSPSGRPSWYAENEVELLLGSRASELDTADAKRLCCAHAGRNGEEGAREPAGRLRYRRLLVATWQPAPPAARLAARAAACTSCVPAPTRSRCARRCAGAGDVWRRRGGGLVGMEVASSARALGLEVTLMEAAPTPLVRALPPGLGRWIAELHRGTGVDVRLATTGRARAQAAPARCALRLSDGTSLEAQTVLVAAGTAPATEWLAASGSGRSMPHRRAGRTGFPACTRPATRRASPTPNGRPSADTPLGGGGQAGRRRSRTRSRRRPRRRARRRCSGATSTDTASRWSGTPRRDARSSCSGPGPREHSPRGSAPPAGRRPRCWSTAPICSPPRGAGSPARSLQPPQPPQTRQEQTDDLRTP